MIETLPTIAELVDLLFEVIRRPDGRMYTEKEVSEQGNITHKTLNHIRTGKTPNPGIATIREICRFFGVSLAYFESSTVEECYAFLKERKYPERPSNSANEILFRSLELSEEARKDILQVIRWVEAAEREKNHPPPSEANS
ncbi:MAG: helix-turn-helix domain-containing protein [Anaerolineae bacterium]|nr:MAG: helix-turn-helix domain-containing protein [Anaerolineae bacterium]